MIQSTAIDDFFRDPTPLIDVRSPGEFKQGHIPGAVNIPLFSDEERAIVGTAYVKQSKEKAIELAYQFVNPKLGFFLEESRTVVAGNSVTVHCWRGGMRSEAFARHLHEHGFPSVSVITGGYKAYRNFVLRGFSLPADLRIVGGYTGSGKSHIIRQLMAKGCQVVDLEYLACHKGSAFGHIGQSGQPTSEQFENNLFAVWIGLDHSRQIWMEDESRNIGGVNIPVGLYNRMQQSPLFFLDIPRAERAHHLVAEYAVAEPRQLADAISRLNRRLGGLNTSLALKHIEEKNFYGAAMITLQYYDKSYRKGLSYRNQDNIFTIPSEKVDTGGNTELILTYNRKYERDQADTI